MNVIKIYSWHVCIASEAFFVVYELLINQEDAAGLSEMLLPILNTVSDKSVRP